MYKKKKKGSNQGKTKQNEEKGKIISTNSLFRNFGPINSFAIK